MINLQNITIVSINTLTPEKSIKALEYSSREISFKKHILFSDKKISHDFIDAVVIDKIKRIDDYNFFCINLLQKYIDTEFCLVIQPDGFVVNPTSWSDKFLNYDYIGAPWDTIHSTAALNNCGMLNLFRNQPVPKIVGNGGFSLRSIKFLKDSANLEHKDYSIPEDNFLCILNRNILTEKQNKFAPVSVARTFAIEHILDENSLIEKPFGFHGRLQHLTDYLSLL